MARPLAADYDDKRQAILKGSARCFAQSGFDRASMADIAGECGISKALLYHYYDTKEQLLVAVIKAHLEDLLAVTDLPERAGETPRERLTALIAALLDCYRGADDEHQVQVAELRRLKQEAAADLIDLERELVRRFSRALIAAVPGLRTKPGLVKPVTMSLFGILNWHYNWFRENGPMSRKAYAELVTGLMVDGAAAALERG